MESQPFAEGTHIGFADDIVRANLRFRPTSVSKIEESQQKHSFYQWQATLDISLTIPNPQASSPYFSLLPAEIRELMHSFVVHFPVIHIKNRPGWLKGWLCCRRHGEVCDNRLFIIAVVESLPLLAFWASPLTCRSHMLRKYLLSGCHCRARRRETPFRKR